MLSKFPGRHSLYLLKHSGKIISIAHTAFMGDLFYGKACKTKQLLCMGDTDLQQIVINGHTKLFVDISCQIEFIQSFHS